MTMKWEDTAHKNPMARARGLGSAKAGTHHWLHQRLTAISNLALVAWAAWSFTFLAGADYFIFTGWLAEPVNAILMILLAISVSYHAALGTQVIVEDYVPQEGTKIVLLIALKLFFFALAAVCVFSVCKIAFGA